MKRRWFAVMGATVLVLDLVFYSGLDTTPRSTPAAVLLGLGGLLLVLGGFDPFPDAVPWYRFVGAGEVLFGAVFLFVWVVPVLEGARTTGAIALALAGAVNAAVLGLVGLDWFHGGRHFDLSIYEPGPILGGDAGEE